MATKMKASSGREVVDLAIGQVKASPSNIRVEHETDEQMMQRLVDDINAHGVIQPLIVFPDPEAEGEYVVADGHRRLAAATAAGVDSLPVIVRESEDQATEMVQMMLATGRNHQPLTRAEEAKGFQTLLDLGYTEARLAREFKQKRQHVKAKVRVADASPAVQKEYEVGRLNVEDLVELDKLETDDPDLHARVVPKVEKYGGHQLERLIASERWRRWGEYLREEVTEAGAEEAPFDARYHSSWEMVIGDAAGDELPIEEHVRRGHKYLISQQQHHNEDSPLSWWVKPKKAKPELTEEEKAERKKLSEIGKGLQLSSVSREKHLLAKLRQNQPSEAAAVKDAWFEIFWWRSGLEGYSDHADQVLAELSGIPKPVDDEGSTLWSEVGRWKQRCKEKFQSFSMVKLAAIWLYLDTREADRKLKKPEGWDFTSPAPHSEPCLSRAQYVDHLGQVWGYEFDEHERAAEVHYVEKGAAEDQEGAR